MAETIAERRERVRSLMAEQALTNSPIPASAVARRLGITKATATRDLNALYERGEVRRFGNWATGGFDWVGVDQ